MKAFVGLIILIFGISGGLSWAVFGSTAPSLSEPILVYQGYLTKLQCEGRLLVSAIGNEALIRLEALPKELGCGVLLKPRSSSGRTNLFLETTTGSLSRIIEISSLGKPSPLELNLKLGVRE